MQTATRPEAASFPADGYLFYPSYWLHWNWSSDTQGVRTINTFDGGIVRVEYKDGYYHVLTGTDRTMNVYSLEGRYLPESSAILAACAAVIKQGGWVL